MTNDMFLKPYTDISVKNLGSQEYEGIPLITSDSRIQGGVFYVPGIKMEACVIDFDKDPWLCSMYDEALTEHKQKNNINGDYVNKNSILSDIFNYVKKKIPYDYELADDKYELPKEYRNKKIILGAFLQFRKGKGVCRHQGLAIGAILEKMTDKKLLLGKAKVRRNMQQNGGGHAWAEYTNSYGEVGILDTAQDFFGPINSAANWNYEVDRQPVTYTGQIN